MPNYHASPVPVNNDETDVTIPVSLAEIDRFADKCFQRGLRAGIGYGLAIAAISVAIWCLT